MKLYKQLNFPNSLLEEIVQATKIEMSTLNLGEAQIHFLKTPIAILNEHLQKTYAGIPALFNCILFHRPGNFPQALHLDCNNDEPPQLMNCAINIPILNCEDSYMEWYDGEYTTRVNANKGSDGIIRKFIEIDWQEQPNLIDKTIINQPTLVKVGVPHKVSVINKTRSLITFRFNGNPSFNTISGFFS
jgi:hypothetical protein